MASLLALSAFAADSPGTFVFSPETKMRTYNNWAEAGYELKQIRTDYRNDGTTEAVEHYFFNAAGRLVRLEIDNDSDGTIDSIDTYAYHASGIVEEVNIDSDNDGTLDARVWYDINSDGTINYQEIDTDMDGAPEETIVFEYIDGRLDGKGMDEDMDDIAENAEYYTYDDLGFWKFTEWDAGNDEDSDEITEYQYYADTGNILSKEVLKNDGSSSISLYEYDDLGRLASIKTDYDEEEPYDIVKNHIWDLDDIAEEPDQTDGDGDSNGDTPSADCFLQTLRP